MWVALVTAVAVLIAGIGLVVLFSPRLFLDRLVALDIPSRLELIAGLRLLIAVSLWFVAPSTEHPTVFRVFAGLTAIAAVALPLIGPIRMARIVDWWAGHPPALLRAWGVLAMGFALFLIWSMYGG